MKLRSILVLSIGLCLPNVAGAGHGAEVDEKLLRKSSRLARVIERNLDHMSNNQKIDLLRLLRNGLSIARGEDSGGGIIVKFELEDSGYTIDASKSLAGLRKACLREVEQTNPGNVDDITVEVGGSRVSLHTSGWWSTAAEQCSVVTSLALQAGAKSGVSISPKQYVLSGDADGAAILADGNSLKELKSSCFELTKIKEDVDDISVSLSGGPVRKKHTSGWWKTSEEVCQAAINLVF